MDQSPFVPGVPPHRSREMINATGADVVTDEMGFAVSLNRSDDVEALLTDQRFGAVAMGALVFSGVSEGELFDLWSNLMFGKDGDEHQRLRGTVSRRFTPKAVERYRGEARKIAGSLADDMARRSSVDLWADFSLPLVARVACAVVGIPEQDSARAGQWAIDLVNAFFIMPETRRLRAEVAAGEFTRYLDDLFSVQRAAPTDDLVSVLVAAVDEGRLTYPEARALAANLVFGGLEATAKVITTGVFHLLEHDAWKPLVDDPTRAAAAAEELLRFAPPTGVGRAVMEDGECRGIPLKAGQMVILSLHSACHDASRFPEPETIRFDRDHGRSWRSVRGRTTASGPAWLASSSWRG